MAWALLRKWSMRSKTRHWMPSFAVLVVLAFSACGEGHHDECVVYGPSSESTCQGDSCLGQAWSSDLLGFGETCTGGDECLSGLCVADSATDKRYCSESCDPDAVMPCARAAGCYWSGKGDSYLCGPPASACPLR